jgi:methionyl aminopeptidase
MAREYTGKEPIAIKTRQEIAAMRKAGALAAKILKFAAGLVAPGVTTDQVDAKVHDEIIKHNAYPSPLNYFSFPKSLCTSINEVMCHGIPDSRPLEDGDIVNLDITVFHEGVHGDCSATVPVGQISAEDAELIDVTRGALAAGVALVRPGAVFQSIGAAVEEHARSRGFVVSAEFVGHGLGAEFHMPPWIVHTAAGGDARQMEAGMVFTIEPILLRGRARPRFRIWSDGWTAVATDGRRSAQFEHTVLVTADGAELLTAPPAVTGT